MVMEEKIDILYKCLICDKKYKSKSGYWKHNDRKHKEEIKQEEIKEKEGDYKCKYCNKKYNLRQNKWKHEKSCKNKDDYRNLVEQVKNLTTKIDEIKENKGIKSQVATNIVNNYTTNTLNDNKKQIIINTAPGLESIAHLTINEQKEIMDKGLDSLMYLIKITNFNKDSPENHSYCVTALNDKHASMIDVLTNSIIKTDKYGLFDKVLVNTIKNLEIISNNKKFTYKQKNEYREKIETLKNLMFCNRRGLKRYYTEINLMSYNNKDVVLETWASLKTLDNIIMSEKTKNEPKMIGFDDLLDDNKSNTETDSDSELSKKVNERLKKTSGKLLYLSESDEKSNDEYSDESINNIENIEEIKVNGKCFIINNNQVYEKNTDGSKGIYYGTYINGKLKKNINI